jgi:hypothetical protein
LQTKSKERQLKFEEVTPELLAQIVRNFILPMFDNRQNPVKQQVSSVHQELKLSDQLEASVAAISKELNQLREEIDKQTSERDVIRAQLKQMKTKEAQQKIEFQRLAQNAVNDRQTIQSQRQIIEKYELDCKTHRDFLQISESQRQKNAKKVLAYLSEIDLLKNSNKCLE